jgi:16S rRNA (cytosine1402-N4)-methyltransferase
MNPDEAVTAYDIVNNLSLHELERTIRDYGEERRARQIAKAIIRAREKERLETSLQLATLVKSVFPSSHRHTARHPATRTFQALRIAVNKELDNLKRFLDKIPQLLSPGGRLVILSYHSLEDRLVKRAMFEWEKGCICPPDLPQCICGRTPTFKRLTKKGIRPKRYEVERNPKARSAIMRIVEKI